MVTKAVGLDPFQRIVEVGWGGGMTFAGAYIGVVDPPGGITHFASISTPMGSMAYSGTNVDEPKTESDLAAIKALNVWAFTKAGGLYLPWSYGFNYANYFRLNPTAQAVEFTVQHGATVPGGGEDGEAASYIDNWQLKITKNGTLTQQPKEGIPGIVMPFFALLPSSKSAIQRRRIRP